MSLEEGAMLEPFAVGLHAVEIAPLVPGATVAVIGCGPIGLFAIQSAKASGATRIIASDLLDYRLVAARRFGATRTVNARHDSIVKAVLEETGGRGSSLSIEAAGASETVQEALDCTMPSGTVVWGGIPREDQVPINPHEARRKELVVRMLRRFCFTYPRAIEVASKGLVDLKSVVTHRFSLDRVAEAFELVSNYADGVIRAVITI